jgi:hypothetical protein
VLGGTVLVYGSTMVGLCEAIKVSTAKHGSPVAGGQLQEQQRLMSLV